MIARLVFVMLMLAFAAGPVFAAPVAVAGTSVHAPGSVPASPLTSAAKWLGLAGVVFGITIRKDTGTLAQKFVTRAGAAQGDYKDGVSSAGAAWQAGAGAAEGNYEAGVQGAIANKQYSKGIQAAGPTKYVNNASTLGAQRYPVGVSNAKDAWQRGVQPYFDAMKGANLPAKGPRRSPQNMQRAAAVASLLAATKVGH